MSETSCRPLGLRPTFVLCVLLMLLAGVSVMAKDNWLQVKSKNFCLVGNASEKDIRKVAVKLEEFRETFRLLFPRTSLTSPIPTNVIVFKSESAFRPFKPRRSDGKPDNLVAGYFQSGEDANYIALSAEGDDANMYNTIFHEYVHFIVDTNFGKAEVPPWFNEGLAEYYSTFAVDNDQKIKLGLPQSNHIYLLQQNKLMPLAVLFKISNRQLLAQGSHSRSIFYAESWALIHYLILGNKGAGLNKFLADVLNGAPQQKAFEDAFQMTYTDMEKELQKYVSRNTYQYVDITLKNRLDFDAQLQASPYVEAEANARLGDLLFHNDRPDDAELYLAAALRADPGLSIANTTMGMVKMRQRKFDEAKQYLEKATAGEQSNHLAFYQYAYLLSREGRDDLGFVRNFSRETAAKIRENLKKAIALAPDFGESYDLLAFVALVNNDQVDEALGLLEKASKMQPGNERYAMRAAELYMRQGKFEKSESIARRFAQSESEDVRARANAIIAEIEARKNYQQTVVSRRTGDGSEEGPTPLLSKRQPIERPMTEEELAKAAEKANIRSINEALRVLKTGEQRVLGYVSKVECRGRAIRYLINTDSGAMSLSSVDFKVLELKSFVNVAGNVNVGCGSDISNLLAVITFKPAVDNGPGSVGSLISLEFVPPNFRMLSKQELEQQFPAVSLNDERMPKTAENVPEMSLPAKSMPNVSSVGSQTQDVERALRDSVLNNIRRNIRQPGPGERRELAFLEKVECTNKAVFFNLRTSLTLLRLYSPDTAALPIRVFAPDLAGVSLDCNSSILDFPAIVVYLDKPDKKLRSAGIIISLDFVPKNFSLN